MNHWNRSRTALTSRNWSGWSSSMLVTLARLLDRAAVNQQVLAENVLRLVSARDLHPRLFELRRRVRLLDIAPGDLVSAGQENPRQCRHASAARAHQVNLHDLSIWFSATSCSTATTRWAASRRPAAAEALAIARSRSPSRPSRARRSESPVIASSEIRIAVPAATIASAFSSW